MIDNLIVKKMSDDDLNEIVDIDKKHFINPWDLKEWDYELNLNPVSYCLVAKLDNVIVGYIDYWITFDSATIAKICVNKSYQRQGLGQMLMNKMMTNIKFHQVKYLTLEVRKSNLPAINLYQKFGFKQETIKQGYYADGEDAIYMVLEVKYNEQNYISD